MTPDEPDWPDFDPYGAEAWRATRDAARAEGSNLTPLMDMHPADRASRWENMLKSEISDERALAISQIGQAVADAAPKVRALRDASPAVRLPDASWAVLPAPSQPIVLHGRRNGHVMVVRESSTDRGRYYAVVDGYHLAYRGQPVTFGCVAAATMAAEAATDDPSQPDPERNK